MEQRVEVSKACGRDAIMGRMVANSMVLLVSLFAPGASRAAAQASDPGRYFAIEVVDEQTGRGISMVELQTTYSGHYYTDSAGLIAFDEPGLMGRRVFFGVAARRADGGPGRRGRTGRAAGARRHAALPAGPLAPPRCGDLLHVAVLHDPYEERHTEAVAEPDVADCWGGLFTRSLTRIISPDVQTGDRPSATPLRTARP